MDIDGRALAHQIKRSLKEEIALNRYTPTLAFFLMEDHAPSKVYVGMKEQGCNECGIQSIKHILKKEISEKELIFLIEKANKDPNIDAILVQMPLPPHINSNHIILSIDPNKDVDGFHPLNIGKMMLGEKDALLPCTPQGICKLLEMEHIETQGKNIVILGRSMIVGRPLAHLLSQKGVDGTVTLLHSKSSLLEEHLKNGDIVIAAMGSPLFIKKEMIKPGAVVIDVGINRINGRLVGDVDYDNVKQMCSKITPVPGGVGPMTIAMLLVNTVICHKNSLKRNLPDKNLSL